MRIGAIAKKIGMTRLYKEDGSAIGVTVLDIGSCRVVGHKTDDKHGYTAVRMGFGEKKQSRITSPEKGAFGKLGVTVPQFIGEFRTTDQALPDLNTPMTVDHFQMNQYVDVRGFSIGKGFAGAMKRHNFGGLRATHGVSVSHRSHGSTGNRQDPGRVFKGKKMAGHMGDEKVVLQNLQVVKLDPARNLIYIHGSVPGKPGSIVRITDAVKKTKR